MQFFRRFRPVLAGTKSITFGIAALCGSLVWTFWSASPIDGCVAQMHARLVRSAYRHVPERAGYAAQRLCEAGLVAGGTREWTR